MIFAIYKPKGPTSNDTLKIIRRLSGTKKVGHAGTLDPLAEGVLVVGIGREATKRLSEEVAKEKEYIAMVRLGVTSTTDDEEGQKTFIEEMQDPGEEIIAKVVKSFIGIILQKPPVYSAIKVSGKEAYKYARRGEDVPLEPREVLVKEIELLSYSWPFLELKVITGPGVYIRALARDIGGKLGLGGYLVSLVRTRVGDFTEDNAVRMEDLDQSIEKEYGA